MPRGIKRDKTNDFEADEMFFCTHCKGMYTTVKYVDGEFYCANCVYHTGILYPARLPTEADYKANNQVQFDEYIQNCIELGIEPEIFEP